MVINTKEILSTVGWDDGFAIPIADEANKRLMEEIQESQNTLTQLRAELLNEESAITSLQEHMKSVDEACEEAIKIRRAKEKEIETELHFQRVAALESSRLNRGCKEIENQMDTLHTQHMGLEEEISRYERRFSEYKAQLDADNDQVTKWMEEAKLRNDDIIALMKYSQFDENRAKEMALKLEKESVILQKKKHQLEDVTADVIMARLELDKASDEYKSLHAERQGIIEEWNNTLEHIIIIDRQINRENESLSKCKAEYSEGAAIKKEQETFLENERANNQDTQNRINTYEQQFAENRQQTLETEAQNLDIISELKALKTELNKTQKDLDQVRRDSKVTKKELSRNTRRVSETKQYNGYLESEMEQLANEVQDAEAYNKKVAQMMNMDNYVQRELENEIDKLLNVDFRKSDMISKMEENNKITQAKINNNKVFINNLKNKMKILDKQIARQNEIIYRDQYRINQVEQKLRSMQGNDKSEVYESLVHKGAILQKEVDEREGANKYLGQQIDRLQGAIRMLNTVIGKKNEKLEVIKIKLVEFELDDKSSMIELQNLKKKKKELLVQQNMLKLGINRLQAALSHHSDNVYSLEKQRIDLEMSVKQRQIELKNMAEVLRTQQRLLTEEKQKIYKELNEKISRIKKLKSKYEVFIASIGADADQDLTETSYMTKSVLAKEEVLLEGSLLDKEIRKSEEELAALTNTYNVMKERNNLYRQSQLKSGITAGDLEIKKSLEEVEESLGEENKRKQQILKKCKREREDLQEMLDQLEIQEKSLQNSCQMQMQKVKVLEKEVESQQNKLERVSKQINKIMKDIRNDRQLGKDDFFLEQEDIKLRCIIERNNRIMSLIGNTVANFPNIGQKVFQLFAAANIPQPPLPGATIRSRGISRTSSRTSTRGGFSRQTSAVSDAPSQSPQF